MEGRGVHLRHDENLWCVLCGFAPLSHWSSIMRESCPRCGLDRHVIRRGWLFVVEEWDDEWWESIIS